MIDPRPLFRLSQGPAPVVYNLQPNNTATYVGTNYGSRSLFWMDGNLHPGYVANWNATVEYQASANNLLKFMYQGSAGVHELASDPERRALMGAEARRHVMERFSATLMLDRTAAVLGRQR